MLPLVKMTHTPWRTKATLRLLGLFDYAIYVKNTLDLENSSTINLNNGVKVYV